MYRPEVGEECLACVDDGDWHKGTLRYISSYTVVFESESLIKDEFYGLQEDNEWSGEIGCIKFRPLKPKRDEEIEEMRRIVDSQRVVSTTDDCTRLYDAGYRKKLPYSKFVSIIQVYISKEFGYNDKHSLRCATELAAKLNRTPDEE